jgi:hypothetical protein
VKLPFVLQCSRSIERRAALGIFRPAKYPHMPANTAPASKAVRDADIND